MLYVDGYVLDVPQSRYRRGPSFRRRRPADHSHLHVVVADITREHWYLDVGVGGLRASMLLKEDSIALRQIGQRSGSRLRTEPIVVTATGLACRMGYDLLSP